MVAIVTVERQRWIQPSGKWGWEREKIEGQCFQDNVRFCLTLRFGKDGCFFMNYPLFPSQAKDWIEIISSLSYNLLSYFVWLHVHTYVHMLTYTHTHTHTQRENSANLYLQVGMWFHFFFLSFLIYFSVCWVFVAVWAFSSCGKWGLPSSCGAQASHCCGFSCCKVRA